MSPTPSRPSRRSRPVAWRSPLCSVTAESIDVNALLGEFTAEPRDEQWQIEALRKSGLEPGPTFLWSPRHWFSETTGLGEVRAATEGDRVDDYQYHPGMMDGGFQLLGALLPGAGEGIDAYVPMAVERIHFYERPRKVAWSIATLKSLTATVATGDIQIMDQSGRVLVKMEGVRLRKVPRDWLARKLAGPLPDWCYELMWTPKPLEGAAAEQMIDADSWLIFDSPGGIGSALASRLEIKGQRATLVPAGVDRQERRTAVVEFLSSNLSGRRGVVFISDSDRDGQRAVPDLKPPAKAAGAASSTYWQAWPTPTRPVEQRTRADGPGDRVANGVSANGAESHSLGSTGRIQNSAPNGTASNGEASDLCDEQEHIYDHELSASGSENGVDHSGDEIQPTVGDSESNLTESNGVAIGSNGSDHHADDLVANGTGTDGVAMNGQNTDGADPAAVKERPGRASAPVARDSRCPGRR